MQTEIKHHLGWSEFEVNAAVGRLTAEGLRLVSIDWGDGIPMMIGTFEKGGAAPKHQLVSYLGINVEEIAGSIERRRLDGWTLLSKVVEDRNSHTTWGIFFSEAESAPPQKSRGEYFDLGQRPPDVWPPREAPVDCKRRTVPVI